MRSAIGGWVLKSLPSPPPRNGFAIMSELVGASLGSSTSGRAAVREMQPGPLERLDGLLLHATLGCSPWHRAAAP